MAADPVKWVILPTPDDEEIRREIASQFARGNYAILPAGYRLEFLRPRTKRQRRQAARMARRARAAGRAGA